MENFIIEGGKTLKGEVRINGAKNAILPIMSACLLSEETSILHNVPKLIDLKNMAHLLRIIGARVDYDQEIMTIDPRHCSYYEAPYEFVSKMRASVYVLGPLLARFGNAIVSFPGGCAIGSRPVDLHLMAMEKLGAVITIEHGNIKAEAPNGLIGNQIDFPISSVGATANTLMAAVLAKGTTVINNAAREPEIAHLIDFLVSMGAQIEGKDTTVLTIMGVSSLKGTEYTMMPDRIEAGTFILASAITRCPLKITNCSAEHLKALIVKMEQAGCHFKIEGDTILVIPAEIIKPVDVVTEPYPGFPTDLQAQFMVYMALADGKSHITDTIFPDRFMHAAELNRLHANVNVRNGVAVINGVNELSGAEVMATDLRASAALVLAGLVAQGATKISRIYHIDRGYEKIEEKLINLGASIKRVIA